MGEAAGDGCENHIGDHLAGQRGPENGGGVSPGQVVGQQGHRHGGEPGADQGDDLRRKEFAEAWVAQWTEPFHPAIIVQSALARTVR